MKINYKDVITYIEKDGDFPVEIAIQYTTAYNENSPDFIYFVTLYNIFNEFLEDISEDVLEEVPPLSLLREFVGGCTIEKEG